MLQLAIENSKASKAFEVRAEDGADEVSIFLYDVIDPYWGVGAEAFAKALASITAGTIHLRVNSPGGDVFEARAMVAAIGAHSAKVIAHIDGLAASAATYVAMAADEVRIADGAFMMIHQAWTFSMGNAADLRAQADLLDKVDASIVADYARKTGKDAGQIAQWMADETWFTSAEAVENGFADTVVQNDKGSSATQNRWTLAAYQKVPKALTAPPEPDLSSAARTRALALLERFG
ncbi:head maturation protease, ClpP-related [Ralstonia syzygii]|uniref:head maturation protease, ClpP-related n=1 Tax=Ralstonia syzygii TaxID=28097 RepID=UPI001F331A16|nr:head maturation protease, ClpP-related [Ralstonia syzygii]